MRKCLPVNTNNSATRQFTVKSPIDYDTIVLAMTRDPVLVAVPLTSRHNADDFDTHKLDEILRALHGDSAFRSKYNYSSLFLIGAGSYGQVFRVVSNASGPLEDPIYSEEYLRYVHLLRKVKSRKRMGLLDSYRDALCLDLVGMKVEMLSEDDIHFNSSNIVQLVKEFCVLTELFRNQSSADALVGFPMPIEFGFVGNQRLAKDLKKVLVFDKYGRPNNYKDTFLGQNSILGMAATDVTNISYFTMELVGPNLDEWKRFFALRHSQNGRMVFSAQTTLKLMDQVLCRLLIMHRKNMVHLDLKPDNLCMGIGKMSNTVYLLDYGLSRVCSDERPTITMGSRRYMSVGVLNFYPTNYMMDIESWFYVLIVLLIDFVPWGDEVILGLHPSEALNASHERMVQTVAQLKKQFWGDDCPMNWKLFQQVVDRAVMHHKNEVPDISEILRNLFAHIGRMRAQFYCVSSSRMYADIINDDSDLFKRYKTLRKLLLYPYDCDFTVKGSCFIHDKDLTRKQEKRRSRYPMLVFAECGRNWQWDWDVWYDEFVQSEAKADNGLAAIGNKSNRRKKVKVPLNQSSNEGLLEATRAEKPGMPTWMKHYLARVLGCMDNVSNASTSGSSAFCCSRLEEADCVLVS